MKYRLSIHTSEFTDRTLFGVRGLGERGPILGVETVSITWVDHRTDSGVLTLNCVTDADETALLDALAHVRAWPDHLASSLSVFDHSGTWVALSSEAPRVAALVTLHRPQAAPHLHSWTCHACGATRGKDGYADAEVARGYAHAHGLAHADGWDEDVVLIHVPQDAS